MALTDKHKAKTGRQNVPHTMSADYQRKKQAALPLNESEVVPVRTQTAGTNIDSSRRVWVAPEILIFPCTRAVFGHARDLADPSIAEESRPGDNAILSNVNGPPKCPRSWFQPTARPKPCHGWAKHAVANEMVLLSPECDKTVSLNYSAMVILDFCDGHRTVSEISNELGQHFTNFNDQSMELSAVLQTFQELNLIEIKEAVILKRLPVKFIVGIEDIAYFHWQLPILFESLKDKLPVGWEMIVIVCNNHVPLSEPLSQILMTYEAKYFTTINHPLNENIDFAGGGDFYVPINRIQALSAVADYIQPDDLVGLIETDIFLYDDLNLDIFPETNTLAADRLIGQDLFFADGRNQRGVKIPKLLEAFDCPHTFKPGGVLVFLTGETIKNKKFIKDCFRFTQILYLMGKIHHVPKVWTAEMPCFALALTVNGIPYDLTTAPEFSTGHASAPTIPKGTFYHYYRDLNDGSGGAFYQSQWYKHQYCDMNMLHENLSQYISQTSTHHEKYFFELVKRAQRRLHVPNASSFG